MINLKNTFLRTFETVWYWDNKIVTHIIQATCHETSSLVRISSDICFSCLEEQIPLCWKNSNSFWSSCLLFSECCLEEKQLNSLRMEGAGSSLFSVVLFCSAQLFSMKQSHSVFAAKKLRKTNPQAVLVVHSDSKAHVLFVTFECMQHTSSLFKIIVLVSNTNIKQNNIYCNLALQIFQIQNLHYSQKILMKILKMKISVQKK